MTDDRGTFEHALFSEPRPEHGYCTDDMARVLVVTSRERTPTAAVQTLMTLSLRFLCAAQSVDGRFHNRLDRRGRWTDRSAIDDCWGRAIWGLGTAAARSQTEWVRQTALVEFERAAVRRSHWPRATAFGALGAAEVLAAHPDHRVARRFLADASEGLVLAGEEAGWPWPEPRLTYANAAVPEAMIAVGAALNRAALVRSGLDLLGWLLDRQSPTGHLSLVPAQGSGPGDVGPGFDQQPIEAAALADACARAATVDDDPRWTRGVAAAVAWFGGDNDGGRLMWDPATGGGFDGLEANGVNRNQGAESTLALLSTLQHARSLAMADR